MGAMEETASTNQRQKRGVRFLALNVGTMILAAVLTLLLLLTTHSISRQSDALLDVYDHYVTCELAANDLMDASAYLTTQSRLFSTTNHVAYLDNYFWEMNRGQRRENDVEVLRSIFPGTDATGYLEHALTFSDNLAKNELYSMKLVVEALDLDIDPEIAAELDAIAFRRGDEELTPDEMLAKARMLVTYEPYEHDVDRVTKQVEQCKDELADMLVADKQQREETLHDLFFRQNLMAVALLAVVLVTAILFIFTMLRPLNEYINRIGRNDRLDEVGAYELRFLARAYNAVFEENQATQDRLTFEAEHDSLTGLYNRGAFEKLVAERRELPFTLIIVDVDYFKEINDQYGHDCGDRVLQHIATTLQHSFRTSDYTCRLGGDEFAVVMTGITPNLRSIVVEKARAITRELAEETDGLPKTTVSLGVAFRGGDESADEMYRRADSALYRVKDAGRNGIAFYDEEGVRPLAE